MLAHFVRNRSVFRFRATVLAFLLIACLDQWSVAGSAWQTWADCKLMPNQFNDGDSFHVEHEGKEYIFRLYFVDTPEAEDSLPERVAEQAAYWNISTNDTIKLGKAAAQFTATQLKTPFTVITRWQNALGRSRLPRHYAFVIVKGNDLAELLTQQGLARLHGTLADQPNGPDRKVETVRLHSFEQEAKSHRRGGWAYATPSPAPPLAHAPQQ